MQEKASECLKNEEMKVEGEVTRTNLRCWVHIVYFVILS